MITFIVYLILLFVSGYFVVKMFGKLTDVSIFEHRSSNRPLFYGAIGTYVLAFTLLFVFVNNIPVQTVYLNIHHAGGLLGYRSGLQAMVYDPSQSDYVAYDYIGAPLPAEEFTEAFDVIIMYKPPTWDYYRDTEYLNLPMNISVLLAAALLLVGVYGMLYKISEGYVSLSHRKMLSRFREISRIPLWVFVSASAAVLVLITIVSAASILRVRHHYSERYESAQKTLRDVLLSKVSPQKALNGYVVGRYLSHESESSSTRSGTKSRQTRKYYAVQHYTVEFRDLLRVPVYLDLPVEEGSEEDQKLGKPFPDAWKPDPTDVHRYSFVVNSDYSISLAEEPATGPP